MEVSSVSTTKLTVPQSKGPTRGQAINDSRTAVPLSGPFRLSALCTLLVTHTENLCHSMVLTHGGFLI